MFSFFEVVLKYIAGQINSVQLTLARFAIGFLFLLPLALYALKKRGKRLDVKTLGYFALLGFTGIALIVAGSLCAIIPGMIEAKRAPQTI